MSLVKNYLIRIDFYGGFGATESRTEGFDNPIEAIEFYKESKLKDFTYEDSYRETKDIEIEYYAYTEKTDKIGHNYKVTPKRKHEFSDVEIEHLLSLL